MTSVVPPERALRERRLALWLEAKELVERAVRNGDRRLTAAEQSRWEALVEQVDCLDMRLKALLRFQDAIYEGITHRGVRMTVRSLTARELEAP